MNPLKTLFFSFSLVALLAAGAIAQTRTLYFYPPDDAKWIAGRSYITDNPANMASAKQLDLEPSKCGWYKATYTTVPPSYVQIWLGRTGVDKIGSKGRVNDPNLNEESAAMLDADPNDYINAIGSIELNSKFNELGSNNIYFVADDGYEDGWYSTDPMLSDPERCAFKLAAFIYDTDVSVHPDFSCGIYSDGASQGNGANTLANCEESPQAYSGSGGNLKPNCTGVRKGLVKPTLNPATRKIEYSGNDSYGCWTSADWFNKAFTSTPGVNVQHCYDMPFKQVTSGVNVGSFEFDSDVMLNAAGNRIGGFFPDILNDAANDPNCPTCNTKRSAEPFSPLVAAVSAAAFDNYQSQEGDFRDGDNPKRGPILGTSSTEDLWDWNARNEMNWYLHNATSSKGNVSPKLKANMFFCFESHAEFMYDPAQEFYFRGDDDIWIYINNQLVIDLGGNHMAAPGHIKLNTLGLTEGETYPIDIFFCDRRSTQSNVRISTNMYVAQKSNFDVVGSLANKTMCITASGGADCASKMGMGSTEQVLCGADLISGGYTVDFFMVRRGSQDTIWLANGKNQDNACSGNANTFECYGGIKVDNAIYTCGGYGQCQGNPAATAKVSIPGNFTVYVRPMQGGVQMAKPKMIDQFKSETQTRVVWGNLSSEDDKVKLTLNDAYGSTAVRDQSVMVGRATPVYVATGSWDDLGTYTSFMYDNEEDFVVNLTYSLSGYGSLKVTADKEGTVDVKFPRNLPPSGVDTVWLHIPWSVGEETFSINVVSESDDAPSLRIHTYHPVLQFTKEDYTTLETPEGYNIFLLPGETLPPLVGTGLQVYLRAWDARRNELCDNCTFYLTDTSFTNNPAINEENKNGIIYADDARIINGKAAVIISGMDVVKDANHATWQVFGPNKELTNAQWIKLQFRESPVPQPRTSYIYDRNGDGIGDSIRIGYSKSFFVDGLNTAIADSLLPVLVEVIWGEDTTRYHVEEYTPEFLRDANNVRNIYTNADFRNKNRAYWDKFVSKTNDSLLVIAEPTTAFSKSILTQGRGTVVSRTPFIDIDKCPTTSSCPSTAFTYSPSPAAVVDRIPPVVVKAEYTMDKTKNCADSPNPGCREALVVYLSEPIYADADAGMDLTKNPFSYCFEYSQSRNCLPPGNAIPMLDQAWNNLDWEWEVPKQFNDRDTAHIVKYKQSKRDNMPITYEAGSASAGDSVLEMTYYAYKLSSEETTRMPKGNDWIKIRPPSSGDVFRDAEGNIANPREIGVQITGTNYYRKDYIKIATIPKDAKPGDDPLNGIFKDPGKRPPWFTQEGMDEAANTLYKPGSVAELLPVPRGMKPDSVKAYYPGSVGTIFDVADNIANEVSKILDECDGKCLNKNGQPLNDLNIAEGITVYASAYYHTNLGSYTAHKDKLEAQCTSSIFQNANSGGGGNCYTNHYNFYLAWDLKANSGRFVGAGAYVAISKFHWQIEYTDRYGDTKKLQRNKDEFIEMFGVRRGN